MYLAILTICLGLNCSTYGSVHPDVIKHCPDNTRGIVEEFLEENPIFRKDQYKITVKCMQKGGQDASS